uniref:BTB domain-containing protein n=1 Tax=Panagrolaimus sp. ES5 TaxID=591445 RepID=A0AC34G309_9BILA
MTSLNQDYVYQMQLDRFNIFQSQDLKNSHFDVKFLIDGKELYAHKFVITSVSKTMDAWLCDRWSSKDEDIIIETYSYHNFYQFIQFLYIGNCDITDENIYDFVDMAEFYDVR